MRLPASILPVGDVAVSIPVGPGSVAHRLAYHQVRDPKPTRRNEPLAQSHREPGPACQDSELRRVNYQDHGIRFAEHSAGWADKLGATACTQCFTEET